MNTIHIISLILLSCYCQFCQSQENFQNSLTTEIYQIGEIKTSLLEPDEFTSLYGNSWILMDGRDVSKSMFATLTGMTNVPDARGKFLRMSNNGASGTNYDPETSRTLGSFQKDSFKKHNHEKVYNGHHPQGSNGSKNNTNLMIKGGTSSQGNRFGLHPNGGDETRPKNILVNYYIKIQSCSRQETPCL